MNKIDLHMHSHHSLDGEKTPEQLIALAKESNINYIAIADHNNCNAYHHIDTQDDVMIIPAIEIDCQFMNKDFHMLGYFINPLDPVFKQLKDDVNTMEVVAGKHYLKYAQKEMGIVVDLDLLNKIHPEGIYTGEGICEASLVNEINKANPYLKEYYPGGKHSISPNVDFYWNYCAQGKIAHTPINFISMENMIEIIRSQNGIVVLAHPGNNTKEDLSLLEGIVELGIDGIEVYSSYHSNSQIQFYKEFAKKHNLIMTCGSDYHGKHKPHIRMGECKMPQDEEQELIKCITNIQKARN